MPPQHWFQCRLNSGWYTAAMYSCISPTQPTHTTSAEALVVVALGLDAIAATTASRAFAVQSTMSMRPWAWANTKLEAGFRSTNTPCTASQGGWRQWWW